MAAFVLGTVGARGALTMAAQAVRALVPPNFVQRTVEALDVFKMAALQVQKVPPNFAKSTVEALDVFKMAALKVQKVPPTSA